MSFPPPYYLPDIVGLSRSEFESAVRAGIPLRYVESARTHGLNAAPFLPQYCSVPRLLHVASVDLNRRFHGAESRLFHDRSEKQTSQLPAKPVNLGRCFLVILPSDIFLS